MRDAAPHWRADVDGLRAVAVGAVVLYHAFPSLLPGGFAGVDVFFVLSGYLIGGLVRDELATGRLDLARFWARRIRRLFPALILVLLASLAAGWCLMLADEMVRLGGHARAGMSFWVNFLLRSEAGYFDVAAELKPLLHLWSLAIEEQFYLLFPLAALGLWKKGGARWLGIGAAAVFVVSLVWSSVQVTTNPTKAFFWPHMRAWELLAGVLLALAEAGDPGPAALVRRALGRIAPDLRALVGAGLIVAGFALLDRERRFPGAWALLPVMGTALVVAAGPGAWLNRTLLSLRPMVALGLISYPLYLWHWPLLSFARLGAGGEVPLAERLGLVALAVALAAATWAFVERPVREGRLKRRRVAPFLLALGVLVAFAGHLVVTGRVAPYSDRFGTGAVAMAVEDWDYPGSDMTLDYFQGRETWRKAGGADGTVLVLGDSNAQQYGPRFRALIDGDHAATRTLLFMTGGGCPPFPGVRRDDRADCDSLMSAGDAMARDPAVRTIVLAAVWERYLDLRDVRIDGLKLNRPEGEARAIAALGEMVRGWVAAGREVVFVSMIPHGSGLDPKGLVIRRFMEFGVKEGGVPRAKIEGPPDGTRARLAAAMAAAGARVVDPVPFLCGPETCPALDGENVPIYKDEVHLRAGFVRTRADWLDFVMKPSP